MRELSQLELNLIRLVSENLDQEDRESLLADASSARVLLDGGDIVEFILSNYERPNDFGRIPYLIEGKLEDEDGYPIGLILFKDRNARLWELEIVRWHEESVGPPNIETFTPVKAPDLF